MIPACRFVRRSYALAVPVLLGLVGARTALEAQLTDLGAHLLIECSAPEACLANEAFGSALAVGDFDGDDFADLAVGVPGGTSGAAVASGSIHLYYGSPGGLTAAGEQVFEQSPGQREAGDSFGFALAAGDFDRDGFDDLAVGIPGESVSGVDRAGAAFVYFGAAAGLAEAGGSIYLDQEHLAPGAAEANDEDDEFGFTMAAGPQGQLALGVPFEFIIPGYFEQGILHELRSPNPGEPFSVGTTLGQDEIDSDCGDGAGFQYRWAWSMVYGHFSHDASLVVGIPGDSHGVGGSSQHRGRLVVFDGGDFLCFDQDSPGIQDVAEGGDNFAHALARGDFDDNGFDDLVIGVPFEDLEASGDSDAGIVQIFAGSTGGFLVADQQLFDQDDFAPEEAAQDNDQFGLTLATGDFDGDGHDDLAVGAPGENVGSVVDAGTVNVLYGNNFGLTLTGKQTFHSDFPSGMPDSPNTDDAFSASLAAGDFDGNGTDDLAIGVPGEDIGAEGQAGAVTVVYGLLDAIDAFGTAHFSSASATVSETTANLPIAVIRDGGAVLAASVAHALAGGSADEGLDFTYTSGTESWAAGDSGVELFVVRILADTLDEPNETIVLELTDPSTGLALGTPATRTLTIQDDDEGGVVQFQLPGQSFSEGAGTATVAVTRTGGAASGVSVQFATANGSAVAGEDFVAQSGTLSFAAGQASQTIQVTLLDDPTDEPSQTFTVTLANATGGATLGPQASTLVGIADNDPTGQIFPDGFESANTSRWSDTVP